MLCCAAHIYIFKREKKKQKKRKEKAYLQVGGAKKQGRNAVELV